MRPTQTWTNPSVSGTYVLLSTNNGLFRFYCAENPFGQEEVLTTSLAGWTSTAAKPFDDPAA